MNCKIQLFFLLQVSVSVYTTSSQRYSPKIGSTSNNTLHTETETNKELEINGTCPFGICNITDVVNYPHKEVEEIMKQATFYHSFFQHGSVYETMDHPIEIEDRSSSSDSYEPFCKTNDVTYLPGEMIDMSGETRTVAQSPEIYQVVKVQTCSGTTPKDNQCTSLPRNNIFKTRCQQKYSVIKLYAVVWSNNGTLVPYSFQIPSTCVCTYKKEE